MITCTRLTKTGSNNIAEPESGVTMLNNIFEQCGQQNIVQYCFYQHREQNMITCSRLTKTGSNNIVESKQVSQC